MLRVFFANEALLFLVLLFLLYLSDCISWLPNGSLAVITTFGRRKCYFGHELSILGNAHGRLVLADPLPPITPSFASYEPPFFLSADGIVYSRKALSRYEGNLSCILWENIKTVSRRGAELWADDRLIGKCHSEAFSYYMHEHLNALLVAKPERRKRIIDQHLKVSLDLSQARAKASQFWTDSKALQQLCKILYAYLLAIVPLIVFLFGAKRSIVALLMGLVMLLSLVSIKAYRLHKSRYPLLVGARALGLARMLLCPPSAIRSLELVSKDLLCEFHPLVLIRQFAAEDYFQETAKRLLLEYEFPATSNEIDSQAIEGKQIVEAALKGEGAALSSFVTKELSVSLAILLSPPTPESAAACSYCPRCLSQFTVHYGDCPSCYGVKLRKFE